MSTISVNPRLEGLEYRFSLDRLAELSRSAVPLLAARLNAACPSYRKAPTETDDPVALLAEIRANCADDDDYIRQSMPLQEIAFRTLLLADDQTLTLGELHHELTERWSSPIRPITVTVQGLARILDSDVFYGFELVSLPEPEVEEPAPPMLLAGDDESDDLMRDILAEIAGDGDEDEAESEDLDDEDDPYEDGEEEEEDD